MFLLIDYREQDFIKNLPIENVNCQVSSLPVGDFILLTDPNDINTIQLVIERKSIRDLCSSITDGRFREQKSRLLQSTNDPSKICYLIEGNKNVLDNFSLSHKIINGSILNLTFKHNYHIIQTENKQDTYNMIILLYNKLKTGEFEKNNENTLDIKLLKRSDKIVENKLLHQLCLIPGVSLKIAKSIESYPFVSIKDLVDKYNSIQSVKDKELLLADIAITEKRRVGKALSKKIYEYICC